MKRDDIIALCQIWRVGYIVWTTPGQIHGDSGHSECKRLFFQNALCMFKFMITLPLCFTMGTQPIGSGHSFILQIICLCFLSSPQHTPKNPGDNQMLMWQQHLERLCKTFPFWHKYLSCTMKRDDDIINSTQQLVCKRVKVVIVDILGF
jgi:hypothetical protein